MEFVVGANLPWLCYGCDFGANAWQPEGGLARRDRTAALEVLHAVADAGGKAVRWFVLCDGRAGLRIDDSGVAVGLDDHLLPDMDVAVDLLAGAGLRAIFVLLDFNWCAAAAIVDGVPTGGRARSIIRRTERSLLLHDVIAPIVDRYSGSPVVLAWEVINEPEWVVTRRPLLRRGRVGRRKMRRFIREAAAMVHGCTNQAVTVGSASAATLPLVAGLGLDFYQVHWYAGLKSCTTGLDEQLGEELRSAKTDAPVLLGEFPTRGSALAPETIIHVARQSGCLGAFGWSAVRKDDVSDRSELERGMRAFALSAKALRSHAVATPAR